MNNIIKNPRITEKSSSAQAQGVYTFDIGGGATKAEIKKAVFALYKVKPVRVNVLTMQRKTIMSRGKSGTKGGGRKAMVYLKPGDKIEFI